MQKIISLVFLLSHTLSYGLEVAPQARLQLALVDAESQPWFEKGAGLTRYGEDDHGLQLNQAIVALNFEGESDWQGTVIGQYSTDTDTRAGISQAFVSYKPLQATRWKGQLRAGFFYPRWSLENPDFAWLSPYTYTNSAINSWIAEEVRVAGLELGVDRPGRPIGSPHSFGLRAGVFKGNDPAGTVLTWRGFALHDRNSHLNDRIHFAGRPSLNDGKLQLQPAWVEPFHEIDGRAGGYAGFHWRMKNHSQLRWYYYDNGADPSAFSSQSKQYAWRTRFHMAGFQHRFDARHRIIAQWLRGDTEMGDRYVFADYESWNMIYSYQLNRHRLSLRWDDFEVVEDDVLSYDRNDSSDDAFTAAWRYNYNQHVELGVEYLRVDSNSAYLSTVGIDEHQLQEQLQLVLQLQL